MTNEQILMCLQLICEWIDIWEASEDDNFIYWYERAVKDMARLMGKDPWDFWVGINKVLTI
jgi:hypothetical protein